MNVTIEGKKVIIEEAEIVPALKNFSGTRSSFGSSGNRDFVIMFDEETAEILANMGYNIFYFNTKNEYGEEIQIPELKIRMRFDKYPPDIYTVYGDANGPVTKMNEETVGELDSIRFVSADISFTPYNWVNGNKSGTAAYLKTMYVITPKKDFDGKYPNV